jgi:hypothetical protein
LNGFAIINQRFFGFAGIPYDHRPIATYPIFTRSDHTQLPESDGTFVFAERSGGKFFQEHPQSILLTSAIRPVLEQPHPDGRYCIGQDSGIYWQLVDPPERGAEAPDWFYQLVFPINLPEQ